MRNQLCGLASAAATVPAAPMAATPPAMRHSASFRPAMTITAPTATPAVVAEPEKARIRRHHYRAIAAAIHHADASGHGGRESDAQSQREAANPLARLRMEGDAMAGEIKNEAATCRRLSRFYFH